MQNNRMTSFCIGGCGWLKLGKQLRSTPAVSTKHGRYRNLQARLDETTAQHEAHWSTATSRETITKAGARKRRSEVKVSDEIMQHYFVSLVVSGRGRLDGTSFSCDELCGC